MNATVQKVIGLRESDRSDRETRTYTISARPDHLDKIEELFAWINMTRSGHSGSAELGIDGDGAARVTVEGKDGELKKLEKDFQPGSGRGPEFKVYLN